MIPRRDKSKALGCLMMAILLREPGAGSREPEIKRCSPVTCYLLPAHGSAGYFATPISLSSCGAG